MNSSAPSQPDKSVDAIRRPFSKRICEILLCVLFLFMLYVLSWGPAYRMLRENVLSQSTFSAIYGPIILIRTHNHFIDMKFYKYDALWYAGV
jgi:hypothetical protein